MLWDRSFLFSTFYKPSEWEFLFMFPQCGIFSSSLASADSYREDTDSVIFKEGYYINILQADTRHCLCKLFISLTESCFLLFKPQLTVMFFFLSSSGRCCDIDTITIEIAGVGFLKNGTISNHFKYLGPSQSFISRKWEQCRTRLFI